LGQLTGIAAMITVGRKVSLGHSPAEMNVLIGNPCSGDLCHARRHA
jgi:hypothetical protein